MDKTTLVPGRPKWYGVIAKAQIFFLELDKFARTMPDVSKMTLMDKWSAYLSFKTPRATLEAIAH